MITFMALEEVQDWLKERELLEPENSPCEQEADYSKLAEARWFSFDLQVNDDLPNILADFFENEEEVLLCITDLGPDWDPALQNIFHRFRQALGDPGTVWDKPGHLFRGDHLDLQSLFRLVLVLGGHMYVVSGSGKLVARLYCMDICSLYAADPGLLDDELLERLDERLKEGSSSMARLMRTSTSPDGKWLVDVLEVSGGESPATTYAVHARHAGGGYVRGGILYIDPQTDRDLQWAPDGKCFTIEWESPDSVLIGGLRAQVPASGE